MTCMTTKKKFEVEDPEVIVLSNGRYAYRATRPWDGKNGKKLTAFKFCSAQAYAEFTSKVERGVDPDEVEESGHPPDEPPYFA